MDIRGGRGTDLGIGARGPAGVVLCENQPLSQADVNDVVTHELIHAYDHCRARVDWTDCVHHACSEIRAANLSGDCFLSKEVGGRRAARAGACSTADACAWLPQLRRGFWGVAQQQQVCVRRRALLSVQHNPNCAGPGVAAAAVDTAFAACFADTAPFERIP
jgi:mitochondrial inner membrane protease ATP23